MHTVPRGEGRTGAVAVLIDPGMGRSNIFDCLETVEPEGFVAIPIVQAIRVLNRRRFKHAKLNVTVGGRRLFWGQSFRVTRDTLDPRPETETLVAEALKEPFLKMLDLGTGTGCILLSCLKGMPMARGVGTDLSAAALAVAMANARDLGLDGRAVFLQSDWFSAVPGTFDLIVSNPPYIAADEMAGLAPEVRDWEPHLALTPGGDGLEPYRIIAREAPSHLVEGGRLLVEIGPTQAAAVSELFAEQGLQNIRVLPDMDGRDRVVSAVKFRSVVAKDTA